MATKVEIFNMALTRIGSSALIESDTEQSAEALALRTVYSNSLKSTLEALDWTFARQIVLLADLGSPPVGWGYQYAYPSTCLKARRLMLPSRLQKPEKFEVALKADGSAKVINADIAEACLRFTMNITNVGLFNATFAEALSWKLGYESAMTLTGKDKVRDAAASGFNMALGNAQMIDANEGVDDELPDAIWIDEYNN